VPVVRRIEAKFRKPASGRVAARCRVAEDAIERWSGELARRGRVSAAIPVEVVDTAGAVAMTAEVEWFNAKGSSDNIQVQVQPKEE